VSRHTRPLAAGDTLTLHTHGEHAALVLELNLDRPLNTRGRRAARALELAGARVELGPAHVELARIRVELVDELELALERLAGDPGNRAPVGRPRLDAFTGPDGDRRELVDPDGPATGRQLRRLNRAGRLELVDPGRAEPLTKAEAAAAIDEAAAAIDEAAP
jgi:hypothetical protein